MKSLSMLLVTLALATTLYADPIEEVRCRETGFSVAVETGDADLFASFIDEDARFVGNSVLHGPAAIAEAWSAFFAADGPKIKWRPRFVEVLEDGKLALTRGPYRMITTDEQGNEQWIDSLFKTFVRGSTEKIAEQRDWLVSVFTDNAGIIKFNTTLTNFCLFVLHEVFL